MTIMITGATGLLGRSAAQSFIADGRRVRLLSRSAEKLQALYGPNHDFVSWDPAAQDFPAHALQGVEAVFHLMGESVGGRWTKAKKDRILASRVTSSRKLAEALRGRPCRLIAASSFAIYPGRRGEVYDENTAIAPHSFIQSFIQDWEAAALSAAAGASKATVIRFGMVTGPEAYPKKLVALFRKGAGFIAGDGKQTVPVVDIADAVGMMRWCAERGIDGVVNCVAPRLPRFEQVAAAIAEAVGKPARFRIPDWLARPILGGSADYFLLSYDIRPARALASGYSFQQTDSRVILSRALAAYSTPNLARPAPAE